MSSGGVDVASAFDRELEEWLVRCCRIDTQSDESSQTTPSTPKQLDLQRLLVDELTPLGVQDVVLTDYGAVLGTVPAPGEGVCPTIAFLARVGTAPASDATEVKPLAHRSWDGSHIVLPHGPRQV